MLANAIQNLISMSILTGKKCVPVNLGVPRLVCWTKSIQGCHEIPSTSYSSHTDRRTDGG